MPTIHEYRREHLRRLIGENGGPSILGKRLGYANGTFLVQMAGPAPMTEVSENTARSFEKKLNLPDRYFDQPVQIRVQGEVVTGRSTKKHAPNTATSISRAIDTPRHVDNDTNLLNGTGMLNGTDMLNGKPTGNNTLCGGGVISDALSASFIDSDRLMGDLGFTPRQRMNYGNVTPVQEASPHPTQPGATATAHVDMSDLGRFIKIVGQLCADENIDISPKKFADVIVMSLVDAEKNHVPPQLDFTKGLLELIKN